MALPQLPDLAAAAKRPVAKPTLNLMAPSGNGWGFAPDSGWAADFSGFGFNGAGFDFFGFGGGGGGSNPFLGGGGGPPGFGNTFPLPGGIEIPIGGGGGVQPVVGTVLGSVGSAVTGAVGSAIGLPAINWGRLAAFLLGLLLIAGGLYLFKPVQQAVNVRVQAAAKGLTETAAA
jgi:hypothetical protein